jgi:SAM-dependent methyltransferase
LNRGAYHRPPADYARSRAFPPQAEDQIRQSLKPLLPPGARVVDIGAGTGRLTHLLLREGYAVLALDLSTSMLRYLLENRPCDPARLRLTVCDASDLPVQSSCFDAAFSVHVLHLLANWHAALEEAFRILAPGGVFLLGLTEHDPDDPSEQLAAKWRKLLRTYDPLAPRAPSYREGIGRWMESRGVTSRQVVAAKWIRSRAPAEHLERIHDRMFPFFREIPDEAFAQLYAQLLAWARSRFASLDRPYESSVKFVWRVFSLRAAGSPAPC